VAFEHSSECFGFYSVFSTFSAIWGPWMFAVVRQVTGSARLAILSIALFFIVGFLLFRSVDIEKGRDNRETLRSPVASHRITLT